jgi:hypothetical protein
MKVQKFPGPLALSLGLNEFKLISLETEKAWSLQGSFLPALGLDNDTLGL